MSFINPIKDGYLTSPFGNRVHPISLKKSWHQGVDIARQPNTNVEVLASADGEVIRAGLLSTYGYVVMIRHTVNGKRMDTNYAHLKKNSIKVKVGQKVKQGDVIAIMGNTGSSTAPHLHFEIHNGAWVTGQKNAVNPELYIELYSRKELESMKAQINQLEKKVASLEVLVKELASNSVPTYNKDEKPGLWSKDAVSWAKSTKPTAISDGTYLKRPITREEAITMLYRANQKEG